MDDAVLQVGLDVGSTTVKAVVLRVNSPGGSVLASEKIKAELDLLQQYKPLVASYGSYAASGGYWISNACDKIYSDALTLTGSIGVFSMISPASRVARQIWFGVTFDSAGISSTSSKVSPSFWNLPAF